MHANSPLFATEMLRDSTVYCMRTNLWVGGVNQNGLIFRGAHSSFMEFQLNSKSQQLSVRCYFFALQKAKVCKSYTGSFPSKNHLLNSFFPIFQPSGSRPDPYSFIHPSIGFFTNDPFLKTWKTTKTTEFLPWRYQGRWRSPNARLSTSNKPSADHLSPIPSVERP